MINKFKFIFIIFNIIIVDIKAQQGVSASGSDGRSWGGSINYTIGQIDYLNASVSKGSLNQGVQHPYVKIVDSIHNPNITLTPNPTSSNLTLTISNLDITNMTYGIFDMLGQIIKSGTITDKQTSVSLDFIANASYFIEVYVNDSNIKTFKVIKN